MSKNRLKELLIAKINRASWWHVSPRDPDAYKKRGKFLASTYTQAEFYGRPNMEPEKVNISNPVSGRKSLKRNRKPYSIELNLLDA